MGWRPNCKSHIITLSKFFEKWDFLPNKDTVEWRIRTRSLGRHVAWVLPKKKDLSLKLKRFPKLFKLGHKGEQTSLVQTSEVESRTQGSRPRPRTQKKSEAKDSLYEDRHSRGQGQECSRPRTKDTSASALQKKKKRSSQKFFRRSQKKKRSSHKFFKRSPQKNVFQKIFQALHKILTIQ